jgi:hypothetical protein
MPICFPSSSADQTDGAVACVWSLRVGLTGVGSDFVAALVKSNPERAE